MPKKVQIKKTVNEWDSEVWSVRVDGEEIGTLRRTPHYYKIGVGTRRSKEVYADLDLKRELDLGWGWESITDAKREVREALAAKAD